MAIQKIKCPICEQKIMLDEEAGVSDIIYCPGCFATLKITQLTPPELEEVEDSSWDEDYKDTEEEKEDEDF